MNRVWKTAKYFWKGPYVAKIMEREEVTLEELEQYVADGYDITTANDLGYTPIDYCVLRGELEKAQLLLRHGAQPNLELHASTSGDHLFLPLLDLCMTGQSSSAINRSLLLLLKNKKLSSSTVKSAIDVLYNNLCNINYEAVSPAGKKENVVVLAGENWGVDVWRHLMKYPINKDLVPIHYRYFLGMLSR